MWQFGLLPLAGLQIASAALGGSAITLDGQQGTIKADRTVPLTTSAATCSAGTLVPAFSKALDSGSENFPLLNPYTRITSSRGSVFGSQTEGEQGIDGLESTSGIGSVTVTNALPVTTNLITSGIGTLLPVNTPTTIVSPTIDVGQGTVVYEEEGAPVEVNLNAGEVEIISTVGSVSPAAPITTQVITSGAGTLGVEIVPTDTLLGMQMTASQGTMAANQDVEDTFILSGSGAIAVVKSFALSGLQITGLQGTVTETEDTTLALVGEASVVSAGDFGFSNEYALTGVEAIGEQYFVGGVPITKELTGAESVMAQGSMFDGDDRDYPLTGTEIAVSIDAALIVHQLILLEDSLITSEQYLFYKEAALEGIQIDTGQGRMDTGRNKDAGHPKGKKERKPKKCRIEIDDQVFECNSREEAEELIEQAKELATARAKVEADELLAAAKADKSIEKINLTKPVIRGDEKLKDSIAAIYAQAQIDAQVALEVARARQLDEEEAIVLLLVN